MRGGTMLLDHEFHAFIAAYIIKPFPFTTKFDRFASHFYYLSYLHDVCSQPMEETT